MHLSHYFCAGKKYLLHLHCNDHLPFKVVCDPTAFNSWTLKSDTRLTVQPHISSLGTSECTQVFFFQPLPLGDHLPQTHHLPHPPLSHQTSAAHQPFLLSSFFYIYYPSSAQVQTLHQVSSFLLSKITPDTSSPTPPWFFTSLVHFSLLWMLDHNNLSWLLLLLASSAFRLPSSYSDSYILSCFFWCNSAIFDNITLKEPIVW